MARLKLKARAKNHVWVNMTPSVSKFIFSPLAQLTYTPEE